MMVDMIAYRRAAVALHALSEEDRRWVLAELPDAERSTLVAYLEELKGLGFASGSAIGHSAIPVVSPLPEQPIEFIRDATADEMFEILDSEPPSLVGQMLAIENWRWKSSFMRMCSPMRRDRIQAAISCSKKPAPALRQFLIQAIGSRVKENRVAPQSALAARSGRKAPTGAVSQAFSSFLRLVRSWKR